MPHLTRLVLAAGALLLAACGSDGASGVPGNSVRLRYVHAIADTSALDVRVRGILSPPLTALPYGAATDYQVVASGLISVSSQPSPSTSVDEPRSIANLSAAFLAEGSSVTLLATGEARDTVSSRAAGITGYVDDLSAPAAGQARLRLINGSPDAGAVDVYATLSGGAAPTVPTWGGVDYRSAVWRTLPAGTYTLTVTPLSEPATVLHTETVTLPSGGVQTAVVRGYAGTLPAGVSTTRRIAATVMVNLAP